MKKFIIVQLLLACFVVCMTAQTVTKNELPKGLQNVRMSFEVDFSQALILGMSESDFGKYEQDWYEDKPAIVRNFKAGTNVALGKSYGVGDYKDAKYVVKVIVNTITDTGFMICDVDILDEGENVLFHLDHLTGGKEPSFGIGTKLARMKVWATLTGKNLGKILKKELSKK